jgi:hypothetical protein
MKTFKVTFYEKNMDVLKVETFHNVEDQMLFVINLAVLIDTLDLAEVVKCESNEGKAWSDFSNSANTIISALLKQIRANE